MTNAFTRLTGHRQIARTDRLSPEILKDIGLPVPDSRRMRWNSPSYWIEP